MNSTMNAHVGLVRGGLRLLVMLAGGTLLCIGAQAADMGKHTAKKSDIDSAYQRERASCLNGTSNEDRATCLKEAGAARDAALHGQLSDDRAAERQNAVARCNGLPPDDRTDCVNRVNGGGMVSGSVSGGGILRETVTTVPGKSDGRSMPMDRQP